MSGSESAKQFDENVARFFLRLATDPAFADLFANDQKAAFSRAGLTQGQQDTVKQAGQFSVTATITTKSGPSPESQQQTQSGAFTRAMAKLTK